MYSQFNMQKSMLKKLYGEIETDLTTKVDDFVDKDD